MAYSYDIFISYKRGQETVHWIEEHFEPLLEHTVELELGYKPVVYRDKSLNDGGTWPLELGIALGSSRVLVPLWTKTYFYSKWCVLELSTMLAREKEMNCRTPANPSGLIIPVVLHDCLTVKQEISHVQSRDIHKYFNSRMRHDSDRAEQLADELAALAPGIAHAIEKVPGWQSQWPEATAASFLEALLGKEQPQQTSVPGFSS